MAMENTRTDPEVSTPRSSADPESAGKAEESHPHEDNIDILRRSWSKKALISSEYFKDVCRYTAFFSKACYKRQISIELATSKASKVFDKVVSDVSRFLRNPNTSRFVFEAGVWDYLITKVFPTPSGTWGGRFRRGLEELCDITQTRLPTTEEATAVSHRVNEKIEEYHEFRARFSRIVCTRVGEYRMDKTCWSKIKDEIEDEIAPIQAEILSTFLRFMEENSVEKAENAIRGIIVRVAELKKLLIHQREVYEIRMAASVDALDQREGFDYNPAAMIPIEESYGLLSVGIEKVEFVVRPFWLVRGHIDKVMGALRRLDQAHQLTTPEILLQRFPERIEKFNGLSPREQARSWRAAQGMDPNLKFPYFDDEMFSEDGFSLKHDSRPKQGTMDSTAKDRLNSNTLAKD
ncbi:Fc.00g034720.m01.CDS01 [Cosmosporella sp. VM-42]